LTGLAAVLAVGVTMSGCGDDTLGSAAKSPAVACEAQARFEGLQFGENPSTADLERIGAEGQAALEQLAGVDGAAAAVSRILPVYRQLAQDGDPSGLGEDVFAAKAELNAWAAASCGRPELVFTATEYAYAGLPADVGAGLTTIVHDNQGTEDHEVQIVRLRDPSVTFTADQISAGDPAFVEGIDYIGVAYSSPAEKGFAVVDLQPGIYVAFCVIPVGGTDTSDQVAAVSAGARTHAQEGMLTTFEVRS
jgi:hypothetical protein